MFYSTAASNHYADSLSPPPRSAARPLSTACAPNARAPGRPHPPACADAPAVPRRTGASWSTPGRTPTDRGRSTPSCWRAAPARALPRPPVRTATRRLSRSLAASRRPR
ncbi:hypothetical protein PAHAL_3G441600 [Panicum hallii]|uniref:Uncharacterized protein n=1 Tax=Panicum hallii TaxID=206008 RepID=A0A2T8KLC5_9POAL|nr:hypothetical protein PAHAL_3G441600 [Panicum hallii]